MNTTETRSNAAYAALIGLDWGRTRHAIALRAADDAKIEQRTLEHSAENLHQWLGELHTRFAGRPIAVAIESARGAVINVLAQRAWITIYPIHPKTSARYREAFTPSGAKDDQPDADLLLALLERHRDRLMAMHRADESTRRLDGLCRVRRAAVDRRTGLLNTLQSVLCGYFPQALELCGEDLGAPLALDLLTRWSTLAALQKSRPETLRSFFYRHNVRRPESIDVRLQRVAQARTLTDDAVVIEVSVVQVQGLIAELRALQKHIAVLDEQIAGVRRASRCRAVPRAARRRQGAGSAPGRGVWHGPFALDRRRELRPLHWRAARARAQRWPAMGALALERAEVPAPDLCRMVEGDRALLRVGGRLLRLLQATR